MVTVEAYILKNCYFSEKALFRLNSMNINSNLKVVHVENNEEDKTKYKKLNKMDTFPQIFISNGKRRHKIGGSSDLDNLERMIDEMNSYNFSIKSFCLFHDLLNQSKNKVKSKTKKKKKKE